MLQYCVNDHYIEAPFNPMSWVYMTHARFTSILENTVGGEQVQKPDNHLECMA